MEETEAISLEGIHKIIHELMYEDDNRRKGEIMEKSEYLGEIKSKGLFFLRVTKVLSKENYIVYNFRSKDGRKAFTFAKKIFTKEDGVEILQIGDCAVFSATPALHSVSRYNNKPETKFVKMSVEKYVGHVNDG